jgi:hypothetical protein
MKRLLEWKQRMLQSPLTRKSSRNASRTQTPTNSDSPVPSLNNDDIRKRVIEELAAQHDPSGLAQVGKTIMGQSIEIKKVCKIFFYFVMQTVQ